MASANCANHLAAFSALRLKLMPAREGATRMPRTTRLKPHSNLLGDMAVGPSSTLMSLHVAQKVRFFKRYGGTTTWRSTPCRAALWTACKEGRAGCRALAGTTHTCTSLRRSSHQRSGTRAYARLVLLFAAAGHPHGAMRSLSLSPRRASNNERQSGQYRLGGRPHPQPI